MGQAAPVLWDNSLRLFYKNRLSLKINNVRDYIIIKNGFPFSLE
jgi:hypothetical protein